MKTLVYQQAVPQNRALFVQKVIAICQRLGFNPNWLMLVMYMESNLNPKAINPKGGASGLIQFMPFVARELGTTVEAIRKMDNLQQLDYVEKYFRKYAKYVRSFTDLYLITFYPKALIEKWPDEARFPDIVYEYNKSLDRNRDKIITIGEYKNYIISKVPPTFPYAQLGERSAPKNE
jgi:hypothetical protein